MSQRLVRVMLADDDELIRMTLSAVCSSISGIKLVGEAADGEDLLAQFVRLRPDVVLLDVNMPKVTGVQALAELKAIDPAICVVMLTATSDAATVRQCIVGGASGYVLKSNPPEDIRATIREVCFKKLKYIVGAASQGS